MVSLLYSLNAFSFAFVLLLILVHARHLPSEVKREERAFWRLIKWVIFFCVQDGVWGICASDYVTSNLPLFISSTLFHLSTVATTFFWLYFIITYLGDRLRYPRLLLTLDGIVILFQVILLTANVFHPTIFHVIEGRYYTDFLRPLAFFNQYVVYLFISILTAIQALAKRGRRRDRFIAVFFFSLAPVLTGVAQVLYPDGPFYSLGYFLGCFIVHIFVVAQERSELFLFHANRQVSEQTKIANTDELTTLLNRHAYEMDMNQLQISLSDTNLVYIALDINGLKVVNDSVGHKAGDELICGAAKCMKVCLGSRGKLYRIGGDEFAAIIYANDQELEFLKRDLEETVMRWHGQTVANLSISYGIATKREFPNYPISEMATVADERMYEAKGAYYRQKGIDRQGQHSAFSALCASYTKILKINLTTDSYSIICMDSNEQTEAKGFSTAISRWLHDFGTSGQVHPDDLMQYLLSTDPDFLCDYFRKGNRSHNIFYRRKNAEGYRQTKMEMIPAEDFTPHNMSLYLYVKDIDK